MISGMSKSDCVRFFEMIDQCEEWGALVTLRAIPSSEQWSVTITGPIALSTHYETVKAKGLTPIKAMDAALAKVAVISNSVLESVSVS